MKPPVFILATLALSFFVPAIFADPLGREDDTLLASYLVTVADDFVVNIYLNGDLVPDSKRQMIGETYGALSERDNIELHKGDWVVFNVVNDRLRWGGASYFAVAGMLAPNKIGFCSTTGGPYQWTYCDDPLMVKDFIASPVSTNENPVREIQSHVWADGEKLIREFAGKSWPGMPIWGESSNTWIKVAL